MNVKYRDVLGFDDMVFKKKRDCARQAGARASACATST